MVSNSATLYSACIVVGGAVRAWDDAPVRRQRYARDAYRMPVECKAALHGRGHPDPARADPSGLSSLLAAAVCPGRPAYAPRTWHYRFAHATRGKGVAVASVSEGLVLTVAQIAATLMGLLLVGMFFYLETGFRRLTTLQVEAGAFLRAAIKLVLLLYALVLSVSLALVAFEPLVVTALYVLLSVAVLAALVEMTTRARRLPRPVRRRHAAAWRVWPPTLIALALPALMTGGWPLAAPALTDAVLLVGALAFFLTGGLLLFAFDLAGVERLAAEDLQHDGSLGSAASSHAGASKPERGRDVRDVDVR